MQIQLTRKEIETIKEYQDHIWETAKIPYTLRGTLSLILEENAEELKMVKRELLLGRVKE